MGRKLQSIIKSFSFYVDRVIFKVERKAENNFHYVSFDSFDAMISRIKRNEDQDLKQQAEKLFL